MATNKFFGAIGIIGGLDGDLDNIDGGNLIEADGNLLIDDARQGGIYSLDATSALTEKSPSTVLPDSNPGTKRWILANLLTAGLKVYEADSTNLFEISQSGGDVTIDNTFDTGIITFQGEDTGNKTMLVMNPAGGIELYYAGTKEAEVESGTLRAVNAFTIAAEQEITGFTGADLLLVSGTKGDANDFPIWNADGDIVGSGLNVAETGVLATAAEWTARQNFDEAAITSAANATAWDTNTAQCALHTLTENTTISAPSNLVAGSTYYLRVIQAAGLFTLAWNAVFEWGAIATPAAPVANGDVVIFSFYTDGTSLYGTETNRTEA